MTNSTTQTFRQTQNQCKNFQWLLTATIFVASLFIIMVDTAEAGRRKNIQMKATISISVTGDADVNVDMEMPMREYTLVKGQFGNAQYLGRMMTTSLAWSEVKNLKGKFVDSDSTVNASMTHVGYARPVKAGKWEIDLSGEELTLVAFADGKAHFSAAMDMPFGATNVICCFELPVGSSNYDYDEDEGLLTYNYAPKFKEGDDGEIDFEIDAKAKVMSSLAKIYGNEKFDNFWVARSKFQNSGDQLITNLRVRHRLAGLSAWSGWKKTKIVYPGQTVIEPFFPVFDIEKIATFTSTRNAMVEVEYKYEMGGEKHSDTDSSKLQVLSRNEVEWSSYDIDEVTSFYELFNNCPQIYGAFTHSNDPVVQKVAATVSRMIDGVPPQTDKTAVLYLHAVWKFMEANRVAYQLPPGTQVDGKMVQHLKYARDVMRNKAGTCADLAVFWASVGKAAGMKPVICSVPGHAFPAFILPESNQLLAIESTMILSGSFDEALKKGMETMGKNINEGTIIQVDIDSLRSEGVYCLDLPRVETDFLEKLGYELNIQLLAKQNENVNTNENQKENVNNQDNRRKESRRETTANLPKRLQGVWRCDVATGNGDLVVVVALMEDASCGTVSQMYDSYGNVVEVDKDGGTWEADDSAIYTVSNKDGLHYEYPYYFSGNQLVIEIDGNQLAFTKQ